jgi:hypothetical protein
MIASAEAMTITSRRCFVCTQSELIVRTRIHSIHFGVRSNGAQKTVESASLDHTVALMTL